MTTDSSMDRALAANALLNQYDADGKLQVHKDKEAVKAYYRDHVNQNRFYATDLREDLEHLMEDGYYEDVFSQYGEDWEFVRSAYRLAYSKNFRFESLAGAIKFQVSYGLRNRDRTRYLERFEDRVVVTALYLAQGDKQFALDLVEEMMAGRYQPATPTFSNAGKQARGDMVSCFILDGMVGDTMPAISRTIAASLELSRRGGGVAINVNDLRERGAPIKGIKNQASGIIPVMKLLENSFSYANQLGTRPGSGAAYISIANVGVLEALDSKRENADEAIRIKTLSLGLTVPDVFFEVFDKDGWWYFFSPYDASKYYGKRFSEIDITKEYHSMVDNPAIGKPKKMRARALWAMIAAVQFESGYPYLVYTDTVNDANPIDGTISLSNLCSEILQVSTPSSYSDDLSYTQVGQDISCNLGSLNIAKTMAGGDLGRTVGTAVRALTAVSEMTSMDSVPSVKRGNDGGHAIGLGQMNLHGYLAQSKVHYGSKVSIDFVSAYFAAVAYHAIKASNEIARERGTSFEGFEKSTYASGEYFDKYVGQSWLPRTERGRELFAEAGITLPTQEDWASLRESVMEHGLFNRYLQAIPPTGSISYVNNSTASILPITAKIEIRKEGQLGRIYYPAPGLSEETDPYYRDAYQVGPKAIIDVYAAATEHVDQGLSCTLFFRDSATTRDLNKAQHYAWEKGLKTLYYVRLRTEVLEGTEAEGCVSCAL